MIYGNIEFAQMKLFKNVICLLQSYSVINIEGQTMSCFGCCGEDEFKRGDNGVYMKNKKDGKS